MQQKAQTVSDMEFQRCEAVIGLQRAGKLLESSAIWTISMQNGTRWSMAESQNNIFHQPPGGWEFVD